MHTHTRQRGKSREDTGGAKKKWVQEPELQSSLLTKTTTSTVYFHFTAYCNAYLCACLLAQALFPPPMDKQVCMCVWRYGVQNVIYAGIYTGYIHECAQREMMHKQSEDYTGDLRGPLPIKILKTNTSIHLLTHHLNTLHWFAACF